MSENALITHADLYFTDIGGVNGRNFVLGLHLKTSSGGVKVRFNPLRLPILLRQLGLTQFSELVGTYVQIMDTDYGSECKGIKSILAGDKEDWFETENNTYFGSDYYSGAV